jgi:wyosine [tRNA(Phe)-imidazoG37] synthetase (radical SAM superfamily)
MEEGLNRKEIAVSTAAPIMDRVEKPRAAPAATAFGCPRNFLDNRFVYTVVSARARGLSIGINMNPDRLCNFDCLYCEVSRKLPPTERELVVGVMAEELDRTLFLVRSGKIREHGVYRELSDELLQLRHVALSGDGEPTLCPNFAEAVQVVVHVRARSPHSFFKLALITNGTGLDLRPVQESLQYFTHDDEIWIKLDAGTQEYMNRVNRSEVPLEKVMENILLVGRQRPVIIQSLFPRVLGEEPPEEEIDEYILRLNDLKQSGARISLVQIYSATRPIAHPDCGHLPLKTLSHISQRIKAETGLRAEVF